MLYCFIKHHKQKTLIYIYRIIAEASVPLFVMKSGALLLSDSKRVDYSYIKKRIAKIALIIAFWGLFYNLLCNALIDGISISIIEKSLVAVITADTTYNYQFWYLYMLLGLYAITPVIRKFTDNASQKDFLYVITLFAVIGFIIPFLCDIFNIDSQSVWVVRWMSPFSSYLLLYYLLGIYLYRYPFNKIQNRVIVVLALLLSIFTLLMCLRDDQGNIETWVKYKSPFTLAYTTALFSLIHSKGNRTGQSMFSQLAQYGLGVYILHPAVIVAMRKLLGIDVNCFAPVISVPILTCIVYAGCVLATCLLKKIPIVRRVI